MGLRKYHTGLTLVPTPDKVLPELLAKGRGWSAHLADPVGRQWQKGSRQVVLYARTLNAAQYACDLVHAAEAVLDGTLPFASRPEAVPLDESNLEGLTAEEAEGRLRGGYSTSGLDTAVRLAARATQRRAWQYALFKYLYSHQSASINHWYLDPARWQRMRGVQQSPEWHVAFAQAIVLAYAVLEELGLEVRASAQNPSQIGGRWNPVVLADLQSRLQRVGVNLAETILWTYRDTPTRVERSRRATGSRAEWAGGIVRDENVPLVDAIAHVSWLRSKVAAHRLGELARSLTGYEAGNAQHLARRVLLERLGFWRAW